MYTVRFPNTVPKQDRVSLKNAACGSIKSSGQFLFAKV